MKTANYILIATLAAIIFGCGSSSENEVAQLSAVAVKVSKALSDVEKNFITASGKIEAKNSANVSTRMMGNVTRMNVQVGERVKKGQRLLVINNTDLLAKKSQTEASILQASSALKNAEKDYKRFQALFEKNSASEKELDDMTTRYEMAKANLQVAEQMKREVEAQFAYTNISSPFDGVVVNTFIKTGDMANPGMPLVSVEGMDDYQATVLISEADISYVRTNMTVKVHAKSIDQEFEGEVAEVSPSAKNTGGQYLVKIDLKEAKGVLPGMFVNVRFLVEESPETGRVLIPKGALVRRGQLTGIYTLGDNQTAILRWLRIGKEYGNKVEVLSGLKANEDFILSAEGKLYNGVKVTY